VRESDAIELLSVEEAAARTGHHPATIRRWAAQGKIDYIKAGRAYVFTAAQAAAIPLSRKQARKR
jgi:excisionase family DNA binding protein